MAVKKVIFGAKGYLEKTYLDKEGAKHATFEFNAGDALEIAKLELMGRDLKNHCPVLLEIRVKQSFVEGSYNANCKHKKSQVIR